MKLGSCIAWLPDGKHLVSGSKTGELQCWDPKEWNGGRHLSYSTKVAETLKRVCGEYVTVFKGLGHQVNTLALSTEYVLRTGPFDHTQKYYSSPTESKERIEPLNPSKIIVHNPNSSQDGRGCTAKKGEATERGIYASISGIWLRIDLKLWMR
ncbi:hypothetical protein POM88_031923 [Heracleum sosnowskyi]|uniref:Uncharacterized protein n=1 Tax=Heracleum sosnowskyi TaxID=360622 RepID=A0AAD8I185_9APIA|nr:hypothetical protein POM88_031923 [Heracleum sosnowskyi]